MKATLFKEIGYSVSKLIESIDIGDIGLPDIQRPFVWTPAKVRDLFDSMYKGFPVGYLLFWANPLAIGVKQIGSDAKQKAPNLLIVDGQQRLTSLYAVIKGVPIVRDDYSTQRIYIAFRPSDERFEVRDAAIDRDPDFIPDISQLWSGNLNLIRFAGEFISRIRERRPVDRDEEDRLMDAIGRLHELQTYPFTALELSGEVSEEQVAEVFVRINSKGVTLNQADFILTLMSVFWDKGRAQLERFCREARQPSPDKPSPFNYFIKPDPDQLLRVSVNLGFRRARLEFVYSILRGKDLETGEFSDERRVRQFAVLRENQAYALHLQNWHEFMKVLTRAGFRSSAMISSQTALLYGYVMFLMGKRDFGMPPHELRELIARWYFMTSLTARYSSSPESDMEADLARLRQVGDGARFASTLNRLIDDAFTEDYWTITLPNDLATAASRGPTLFGYYAALSLLDARVPFSPMKVQDLLDPAIKANKASLERHHLFPKNYLRKQGIIATAEVNQIANFALIEWPDNIEISDEAPMTYFPRFAERLGSSELEEMRYHHALPVGWENLPYEEFLVVRRKAMAHVIRAGFSRLSGVEQINSA